MYMYCIRKRKNESMTNKNQHSVPLSAFRKTYRFFKPYNPMVLTIDVIMICPCFIIITQEVSKNKIFF